jgi:hypothetical protein
MLFFRGLTPLGWSALHKQGETTFLLAKDARVDPSVVCWKWFDPWPMVPTTRLRMGFILVDEFDVSFVIPTDREKMGFVEIVRSWCV